MKILQNNFVRVFAVFSLCTGIAMLPACKSDDDTGPCSQFECLNGGEKIAGIDNCSCDCPPGYSGDNCQTKDATCPANVECPFGQLPNPANNCKCE
jgi:hypothetical protein